MYIVIEGWIYLKTIDQYNQIVNSNYQRIIIYGTFAEYQSDSWTINNKPTIELYKTLILDLV